MASVLSGQGLTQVIEKAETTLGIPSPTELSAQVEQEQREQGEWWDFHVYYQCISQYLVNFAVYCVFALQVRPAATQIRQQQMDLQLWAVQWEC